jgi:methyl-accepting chemotaxis protein
MTNHLDQESVESVADMLVNRGNGTTSANGAAKAAAGVHGFDPGTLFGLLEAIPLRVMFADRDLVIRYVNPASLEGLRELAAYLPVPPNSVLGQKIDIFHKNPEVQQRILADDRSLPRRTVIMVGPEALDLNVTAVYDEGGEHMGFVASWSNVTEKIAIGDQARAASANIEAVASAAEEMTTSIREVAKSASDAAKTAASAVENAASAQTTIGSLGDSSAEIGKVVKVITSIAQQTNLLALNATIEAARAGEAGKGFAVVANEVKELAKETAKATEDISAKIEAIQSDSNNAVSAIEEISHVITAAVAAAEIAAAVDITGSGEQ